MERVILHSQRISYEKGILDNLTANTNPFELFKIWYLLVSLDVDINPTTKVRSS